MKKLTRLLMISLAGATFLAACGGDTTTIDEEEPAVDEMQEDPMEEVEEEPAEDGTDDGAEEGMEDAEDDAGDEG